MLQVKNTTPFPCAPAVSIDQDGRDVLLLAIKATFTISPKVLIAEEQMPLTLADEFYDDPANSSLKYPTDVFLPKPGSDVILVGSAHAPNEQPVSALIAQLVYGNVQQAVQVTGNRVWQNGQPSQPEPFQEMSITYEKAYGGVHHFLPEEALSEKSCVFIEDNPVGLGFAGKHKVKDVEGLPVPNVEDPRQLIRQFGDKSSPVGFGAIAPAWMPRRQYAGTYDQAWLDSRSPALPLDFNPLFFQAGSNGLSFADKKIEPGVALRLINLAKQADIQFTIPYCPLDVSVKFLGARERISIATETLLIEPDLNRFSLTLKGLFPCERKATFIEEISVNFAKTGG